MVARDLPGRGRHGDAGLHRRAVRLSQADMVWSAVVGTGLWYEFRALRNMPHKHPDTLSATTRRTFRTDTTAGRVAFGAFWLWFLGHVLGWWR